MNGHEEETPVSPEETSSQETVREGESDSTAPDKESAAVIDDQADEDKSDEEKPEPALSEELNIGQEQVLELISYIVVNLVEHPDEVTVDIAQRQGRDIYQVRVHQEDLGKVIGKGGQTARALRVLLMAVSARTDQRIGLEIVE